MKDDEVVRTGLAVLAAVLIGLTAASSAVPGAQSPEASIARPVSEDFHELTAAGSDSPAGYLAAIAESMRRFLAAQAAGDREAMSRQLTALRLYASRLAEMERRQADELQQAADALSADDPERDYLGRRAVLHRELADETARLADIDGVPDGSRRLVSAYMVGNPTDRDATVDLRIRRVSIPPNWELSIVDAQGQGQEEAEPLVQEVAAGEHYRVRLPAGGETRVASVLVPVGPVGQNTTARWAVEGYIRDELIGGMMHEMHVPAVLEDLELPPVAGIDAATPLPETRARGVSTRIVIAAGALLLVALILFVLLRRVRAA